jgi:hypothetical protein
MAHPTSSELSAYFPDAVQDGLSSHKPLFHIWDDNLKEYYCGCKDANWSLHLNWALHFNNKDQICKACVKAVKASAETEIAE